MMDDSEYERFDDTIALALAQTAISPSRPPAADLRQRLLARCAPDPLPPGFAIRRADDSGWRPHPVPGIMMKVLSVDRARGCATLLLDVAPGTRFPAHHHGGAEECYVISGTLHTCGRRLGPGDFVHADAGTDHGELWTQEGCRVLLVAGIDDDLQPLAR